MARDLNEIAQRLDELTLDYDWPELVTLSEEIGMAAERHDHQVSRLEMRIKDLEEQLRWMQDPRERERQRMEEQYRRDVMAYKYAPVVPGASPIVPTAVV